ncbi:hypothetical protein QJQ45_022983 [Haematococcus lacustris]|nr:hypothetical protein QJQ45_022983 [Haematococcus lacustris]
MLERAEKTGVNTASRVLLDLATSPLMACTDLDSGAAAQPRLYGSPARELEQGQALYLCGECCTVSSSTNGFEELFLSEEEETPYFEEPCCVLLEDPALLQFAEQCSSKATSSTHAPSSNYIDNSCGGESAAAACRNSLAEPYCWWPSVCTSSTPLQSAALPPLSASLSRLRSPNSIRQHVAKSTVTRPGLVLDLRTAPPLAPPSSDAPFPARECEPNKRRKTMPAPEPAGQLVVTAGLTCHGVNKPFTTQLARGSSLESQDTLTFLDPGAMAAAKPDATKRTPVPPTTGCHSCEHGVVEYETPLSGAVVQLGPAPCATPAACGTRRACEWQATALCVYSICT